MEATVFHLLMQQKLSMQSKKILNIKSYPLCFGNISKDFTANNMKRIELYGYVYDFSVDY